MNLWMQCKIKISTFRQAQSGAALVEFAILLPILLLLFAVIVEGGRMMWSYQTTVAGVRDAARYLARVAPQDICSTGGTVAGYTNEVDRIVQQNIGGANLFPSGVSVLSVTPSLSCVVGTYRVSPAGVVQVSAVLQITFPFSGAFSFSGQAQPTVTTTITDQSRVFGT